MKFIPEKVAQKLTQSSSFFGAALIASMVLRKNHEIISMIFLGLTILLASVRLAKLSGLIKEEKL